MTQEKSLYLLTVPVLFVFQLQGHKQASKYPQAPTTIALVH